MTMRELKRLLDRCPEDELDRDVVIYIPNLQDRLGGPIPAAVDEVKCAVKQLDLVHNQTRNELQYALIG